MITRQRDYRGKNRPQVTYECQIAKGRNACNTPMVDDADVKSFAHGVISYRMKANWADARAL